MCVDSDCSFNLLIAVLPRSNRIQFTGITSSPSKLMDLQVLENALLDALWAWLHMSSANVECLLIDLWSTLETLLVIWHGGEI